MRTLLPLEEALDENPQINSLIGLFEEDSGNLFAYANKIFEAVRRVLGAQNEMTAAMQNLSSVLGSYKDQKLPLDQMEYDMPDIADKLHKNFHEVSSWAEILGQQLTNCVLQPLSKLTKELSTVTGPLKDTFHMVERDLSETEVRFSKMSRKESHRKLEEANSDVFFAKRNFHEVALKYYAHQNAVQFLRYTHIVEPLLSLTYALRSYFQMGADGLKQSALTEFLTQTQEQIQSIHGEYKEESSKMREIQQSVLQIQKLEPEMYFEEPPKILDGTGELPSINPAQMHKQGFLYLKSKSGFMSKWERQYFFIQGSQLMHQSKGELAGQLFLDISDSKPIEASLADLANNEDRRNTFSVTLAAENNKPRQFIFQARNVRDLLEWITAINNIAGCPNPDFIGGKSSLGIPRRDSQDSDSPSAISKPLPMPVREDPHTPTTTPASFLGETFGGREGTLESVQEQEPIQFDILGDDREVSPIEGPLEKEPGKKFPVRFLGSMEVSTDRGDRLIQETIRKIMSARATHNIFKASEQLLIVDDETSNRLLLVDASKDASPLAKIAFPLEDLAFWTAHPDNKRLFAFISKSRTSGQRSKFMCYVFEAHESGAEVCQFITEGTRKAFQALLVKKTASQASAEEEEATAAETVKEPES